MKLIPEAISSGINTGQAQVLQRGPGIDAAIGRIDAMTEELPDIEGYAAATGEYWDADHDWMQSQALNIIEGTVAMEKEGLDPTNPNKQKYDRKKRRTTGEYAAFKGALAKSQNAMMLSAQQKQAYDIAWKTIHSDPVWNNDANKKALEEWRAIADPIERARVGMPKFTYNPEGYDMAEALADFKTVIKNPDEAASYSYDSNIGAVISNVTGEFSEARKSLYGKLFNSNTSNRLQMANDYEVFTSNNPDWVTYYEDKAAQLSAEAGALVTPLDVYTAEQHLAPLFYETQTQFVSTKDGHGGYATENAAKQDWVRFLLAGANNYTNLDKGTFTMLREAANYLVGADLWNGMTVKAVNTIPNKAGGYNIELDMGGPLRDFKGVAHTKWGSVVNVTETKPAEGKIVLTVNENTTQNELLQIYDLRSGAGFIRPDGQFTPPSSSSGSGSGSGISYN